MNITSIGGTAASSIVSATGGAKETGGASFGETLAKAMGSVNNLQLDAQAGAQALAAGTASNMHDVTIALEQANIALQMTAAVRNKVVEAYQEIMRMPV